jgi:hypothetical protein
VRARTINDLTDEFVFEGSIDAAPRFSKLFPVLYLTLGGLQYR